MFYNIGFTEILVIALVSFIVFDKKNIPDFISFIRVIYKQILSIKIKIKESLNIEELYDTEEIKYITGKDGKLYPAYSADDVMNKNNDSKSSSSR